MSLNTILLPHDGSALSGSVAASLAPFILGAASPVQVVLLHVADVDAGEPVDLDATEGYLSGLGARVTREYRTGPDAAATILSVAGELSVDLVAMSTHGRSGLSRWVRGSVAERVLRACPVPLWLSNPRSAPTRSVRSVLIPMDGSECANGVLGPLVPLLTALGAEVTLLYVDYAGTTDTPGMAAVRRVAREADVRGWLAVPMERLQRAGIATAVKVVHGAPAEEILRATESGAFDLLAMATHGRSGPERWVLGSTAEKVLAHSAICTFVVRARS